ncbi:hypothetical protein ACIQCF_14065 [Streptomyces sp. NPDC088353]|uniref:hypothetical protein n=1 Tax=unclassified Streptomyces TaxID=2593676 RepID=UPI0036BD3D89
MVEALHRAVHAADDLAEVVRRMVRDAHAGDTSRKAADTALAAEREHLLYQAVKGLRAAAADVLGEVGHASRSRACGGVEHEEWPRTWAFWPRCYSGNSDYTRGYSHGYSDGFARAEDRYC